MTTKKKCGYHILVCHHAGGTSLRYRQWKKYFSKSIEYIPIDLPGRLNFSSMNFVHDCNEVVKFIHSQYSANLSGKTILFGHSLGGLIMYEYAKFLEKNNIFKPIKLFISGCMPPSTALNIDNFFKSTDSDAKLFDSISAISKEFSLAKNNISEVKYFFNLLRNDYRIMERYNYIANNKLHCPLSVYYSEDDPITDMLRIKLWEHESLDCSSFTSMRGDHFFIFNDNNRKRIVSDINKFVFSDESVNEAGRDYRNEC